MWYNLTSKSQFLNVKKSQWEKAVEKNEHTLFYGVSCFRFLEESDVMPSDEEQYYSDDENLGNDAPVHEDEKNIDANTVKSEENENGAPANEKTGNYYKDIKQCKFLKFITYVWLHWFDFP